MPIFSGDDLDGWLFRAEKYFEIHGLIDIEKVTVAVISFEGVTISWYRWESREHDFKSWDELKIRIFVRFRPTKEGSLCARFLSIRQEGTVAEYHRTFEEWAAPVRGLTDEVLESTFTNGLHPLIRAEVLSREVRGLKQTMRAAQLVEDRNIAMQSYGDPTTGPQNPPQTYSY